MPSELGQTGGSLEMSSAGLNVDRRVRNYFHDNCPHLFGVKMDGWHKTQIPLLHWRL